MKKEIFEQQIKLAIDEYKNSDKSVKEISEKYGMNSKTLSVHLKKSGIDIERRSNRKELLRSALSELTKDNVLEISNKYNIDPSVLEFSLNHSGLTINEFKQEIIKQALDEYLSFAPEYRNASAIAKKYGLNKKTIYRHLEKMNIKCVNNGTKSVFNSNIFDSIDTEEKAYWLGFMYADGYISSKGHSVGLGLSIKDSDHMDKYCNFLNYKKGKCVVKTHQFGTKDCHNKAGDVLYMITTKIENQELWNGLNKHGCIPNKSLILTFPNESIFIESDKYSKNDLIRHFIRGYFDGDGTLGKYLLKRDNRKVESLMFVGTKPFLEKIQEYIGKGFLMQKKNCSQFTYRLGYSNKKARDAADYLYKNSNIYLSRKYNIYINEFAS